MNPSAGEEILSAAEVPKTNQVTVATVTTSPFPEKSDQKCPESRFLQSFLLIFSVTIFI